MYTNHFDGRIDQDSCKNKASLSLFKIFFLFLSFLLRLCVLYVRSSYAVSISSDKIQTCIMIPSYQDNFIHDHDIRFSFFRKEKSERERNSKQEIHYLYNVMNLLCSHPYVLVFSHFTVKTTLPLPHCDDVNTELNQQFSLD